MRRTILFIAVGLAVAGGLTATACSRGGGKAAATLEPKSGSQVTGSATFTEKDGKVEVTVEGRSLSPGKHGVHVHEKGDCSASDASSAGPHFNPNAGSHAGPGDPKRHAGDLGNLEAGADGKGTLTVTTDTLTVASGDRSVIGRAIVIHGDADDLKTQPSGNSGGIVSCGAIHKE